MWLSLLTNLISLWTIFSKGRGTGGAFSYCSIFIRYAGAIVRVRVRNKVVQIDVKSTIEKRVVPVATDKGESHHKSLYIFFFIFNLIRGGDSPLDRRRSIHLS